MKKSIKCLALVIAISFVALAGCSSSGAAAGSSSAPQQSAAVDYPKNAITVIIPTSPGGGYDLGARLIAKYLPKYLPHKVDIICANQSGGAQMIGVHTLYAAKNDGYTIGAFNATGALLAQYTRGEEITFDMSKFNYIGMWQEDVRAIGVSKIVKAKTWDDLVAMGTLKVGTGGKGTGQHSDSIILDALTDLSFKYVHYDGSALVEPAMGRGEIELETAQVSTILSLEEQGMGRAFCVLADQRDPSAPDVPTALEVGMPQEQYDLIKSLPFFGVRRVVACPPDTDPAVVEILRDAFWKVVTDPEYIAELEKMEGTDNPAPGKEVGEEILKTIGEVGNYQSLIDTLKENT